MGDYYAPEYKLHIPVSNMENENSPEMLEKTRNKLFEIISQLEHVPSVQMQTGNPGTRRNPDASSIDDSEDDDEDDVRPLRTKRVHLAEFFDEDDASGDL